MHYQFLTHRSQFQTMLYFDYNFSICSIDDDTLNALLIVNKHYKKVKQVQEARMLMKLPLNLQPNHVINPVMHPNPETPIEMWREPELQQPK